MKQTCFNKNSMLNKRIFSSKILPYFYLINIVWKFADEPFFRFHISLLNEYLLRKE